MATPIGTKVRLIQDVDNFPDCLIEAGETGTLVRIDDENSYWVKLDKHFSELNEWENELQIRDFSKKSDGDFHPETYIEVVI